MTLKLPRMWHNKKHNQRAVHNKSSIFFHWKLSKLRNINFWNSDEIGLILLFFLLLPSEIHINKLLTSNKAFDVKQASLANKAFRTDYYIVLLATVNISTFISHQHGRNSSCSGVSKLFSKKVKHYNLIMKKKHFFATVFILMFTLSP